MSQVIGVLSGKGGVGKTALVANLGTALRSEFGKDIAIMDANTNAPHLALHMKGDGSVFLPESPSASKMKSAAKRLSQQNELVIMDIPPGLGKEVVTSVSAIDSALVVMTPDFPSVVDAMKALDLLRRMNKGVLGLVVNRRTGRRHELSVREIESICGHKVVGVIPDDVSVQRGVAKGRPSVLSSPRSKSSAAFKRLAGKLAGEKPKRKGLLGFLRKMIR